MIFCLKTSKKLYKTFLNTDNEKPIEIIFKTGGEELKADEVRVWGDTLFIEFYKNNTFFQG